jgi:hypothetical protein
MPLPALRRLVLSCLAVVLIAGSAPTQATAAGVLDLDRLPVVEPYIQVLGASSSGVLYRVSRIHDLGLVAHSAWVKPAGAPAYQVDVSFKRLAGDKIFGATAEGVATYQYIGTPQTHTCPDVPQPVEQFGRYDGVGLFASFGWLGTNGERVEVSPTGCRVTAKYPSLGTEKLIAMDDVGYVTMEPFGVDGGRRLTYQAYADPLAPRTIADGGYNKYLSAVSLAGTAISWRQYD